MGGYAVPEAVIFDWGGTLTPWHDVDPVEQWSHYAEVYAPDDAASLTRRLAEAESRSWGQARDHARASTLDHVLREAGVEPGPRHEAALAAYHLGWEPHTFADPEAADVMRGLRTRGLAVGILSNTLWTRDFHESVFARDGLLELIDGAVYSSELEWTKPHEEAFRAAMRAVGVDDPAACVFVGDRPFDDIHGAKEVGMRAVLVPHSAIPELQRGAVAGEPDATIQRLSDLLPLVDEWSAAGRA